MRAQTNYSILCDPEALAANTRGEVTAHQRQAIRARLPGRGNEWFMLVLSVCILGFVIYEHRLLAAIFFAKDPLPAREHIWRWTVTIPSLHVLVTLIVGSWVIVLLGSIGRLIRRARAIRELRPGHVRYADGTIMWDGDGYVARIPHRHDALTPWDLRAIASKFRTVFTDVSQEYDSLYHHFVVQSAITCSPKRQFRLARVAEGEREMRFVGRGFI